MFVVGQTTETLLLREESAPIPEDNGWTLFCLKNTNAVIPLGDIQITV